jgi:hypothetical protein
VSALIPDGRVGFLNTETCNLLIAGVGTAQPGGTILNIIVKTYINVEHNVKIKGGGYDI